MIPKTLLTLIEGYNSLYSKVGENQSFNTEKIKHLISNTKGAITIGASVCFAVKIGLVRKEKSAVYYFTRKPFSSDVQKIFNMYKDHATNRVALRKMVKQSKQGQTLFGTDLNKEVKQTKKPLLLEDASIYDIVNRIKTLGFTGELIPIKKSIIIN